MNAMVSIYDAVIVTAHYVSAMALRPDRASVRHSKGRLPARAVAPRTRSRVYADAEEGLGDVQAMAADFEAIIHRHLKLRVLAGSS